jgi:hypothetical protein
MILLDVDPNWVRPGWTPLLVTLLLAAAMVFLYFSMRKQFRKIRASDDIAREGDAARQRRAALGGGVASNARPVAPAHSA